MTSQNFHNKLLVLTAPSGAGKTTIVHHLLKTFPFLGFSVSATTRKKRGHEVDGTDYYFLREEAFREKINAGQFAEFEEVYPGQYYGTLRSEIERLWSEGKVVVFDIDVKGASRLKELYGEDCFVIFVKPPSLQILIDRLKQRKTESEASLRKRVARSRKELSYEGRFDAVLVNDLLEVALKESEILVKDFLDLESDGNKGQ